MYFVFLDEFGHIGPFVSKHDPSYRTSPVFGIAGFWIHEKQVRELATWFYRLKRDVFQTDIGRSGKHANTWEKKGYELFTSGRIYKTKRLGYTLINTIQGHGGKVFYHGIEKYQPPERHNPTGIYYTVLRHAINHLERAFANKASSFIMVMDEHESRVPLLESSIKAMFDRVDPAKYLIEPPYHVESHLYQTVQMADWLASIIGSLWTYRAAPIEFSEQDWAERLFARRIESASQYSTVRLQHKSKPKIS